MKLFVREPGRGAGSVGQSVLIPKTPLAPRRPEGWGHCPSLSSQENEECPRTTTALVAQGLSERTLFDCSVSGDAGV